MWRALEAVQLKDLVSALPAGLGRLRERAASEDSLKDSLDRSMFCSSVHHHNMASRLP